MRNRPLTVGAALSAGVRLLTNHDVPDPISSARELLRHVLGEPSAARLLTIGDKPMRPGALGLFFSLCHKRCTRYPLQYLVREWPFRNLNLTMKPPVLIPRPETEFFVDLILEAENEKARERAAARHKAAEDGPMKPTLNSPAPGGRLHYWDKPLLETRTFRCLDVGVGSGAILLSLLAELPDWTGVGIDVAQPAVDLARLNARRTGLDCRSTIFLASIDTLALPVTPIRLGERFDLIVSNPPYIPTQDLDDMQAELHYEDEKALDGGHDGLAVIRQILSNAARLARNDANIWLEVDHRHPPAIRDLVEMHPHWHLKYLNTFSDQYDGPRFCQLKAALQHN